MKFCIATLTHRYEDRDVYLRKTIESFIDNTEFDGMFDWYIHCNGQYDLMDVVIKEMSSKYWDKINFYYSSSPDNMGVGVGINYLNSLVRDYEYVLFLEGDWICLPGEISGHNDWLRDCLNYLDKNKNISQVLLRRYISDLDDRQYGYGYWIREDNIKSVGKLKNTYLHLHKKEYTNNPYIRRNNDFYDKNILPLNEFYDENGLPNEIKGLSMWGQAEIQAESKGYEIESCYLAFGNMVHCEAWHYYKEYDKLIEEDMTCKKYLDVGKAGCKYGYFFPAKKFCDVCDHSKNFMDLERHEQEYESKL
jgi:hypothetical protein